MNVDQESVVVITGASRGIGEAAALSFAAKGAKVVIASRDQARMNRVAERVKQSGGDPLVVTCDVSNEEQCHQLAQATENRFGRIDVLINNAGFGTYASIEDLKTEYLDRIFRTNLYGTIWCTQAVLPLMKKQRRGHIVNISTIISKRSIPFMTAYCMTKFAMNAFDEGLRLELRRYGIGVSLVCPGLTATDFQDNSVHLAGHGPPDENLRGMTAQKVGEAILKAVERNRRDVSLTLQGRLMLAIQRVSPRICDELVYGYMRKRMKQAT